MTWQESIKQAIESIPFAPYSQEPGQQGVSENIYWQGELLFKSGSPPKSHCSGALGEAITKALKLLGLEDTIPYSDMEYLKQHGFIYNEETQFGAYPGAIVSLGWGNWVGENEVEYGDIAQFWFEDNYERQRGHSVIITGLSEYQGKPVFKDWSATNLPDINGHGYDWHLIEKQILGKYNRTWYIARPDVEMIKNKYLRRN